MKKPSSGGIKGSAGNKRLQLIATDWRGGGVEKEQVKGYLKQFLDLHGVEFNHAGKFLCPYHDDDSPSMSIEKHGINAKCFACGETADIFKFAAHFYGLDEKRDFAEIKRRVEDELGRPHDPAPAERQKPAEKPVTLSHEAAKAIYKEGPVLDLGYKISFAKDLKKDTPLKIERVYPCQNEAGDVEFIEVRFSPECFTDGKKRTAAMWWNGKSLLARNTPRGLFGRDILAANPGKPVLIVEGPKCWDAAKVLTGFVPIAWNGGANGQKRLDFSPLKGRRVYIWPDDDEAGAKSALATEKLLKGIAESVIIVPPMPEARAVKPEKADIVEALQVKSPEEVAEYILNSTPPEKPAGSDDHYIYAGEFLEKEGFYRIYEKGLINFFSDKEDKTYSYKVIEKKYKKEPVAIFGEDINPAEAAIMINNLDPVYPVYRLVKSYFYPPKYRGRNGGENEYIINRWKGFPYPLAAHGPNPEAEKEAEFVRGHIRDVLCGGSGADYEYLCKWIAHMMKKPDVKPGVAVFAHSMLPGTGKSIIFENLIPNMLGKENTISFSNEEQIADKFNLWLFTKLYAVFSEKNFYKNSENLKSWITEENQTRREMHAEADSDRSCTRFVICTNRETAFRFENSERRMFVLSVSDKMVGNRPYFTRLGRAVNNASVLDELARFFTAIDIAEFNPFDVPGSEKKRELIEAEKPPVISFFETVAYNEDPKCKITPCDEADPDGSNNYHESKKLYEVIKKVYTGGEKFIERGRLYEAWRNGAGRNKPGTINSFSRTIRTYYTEDQIEMLDQVFRDGKKMYRVPVIIIKEAFYARA
jgi:hypothetical protein